MEPVRDGRHTTRGPAFAGPTGFPPDDASERASSPQNSTETASDTSGHDSLVTVRLSEPPSLHVNTAVPPSTILVRRSSTCPDYSPGSTITGAHDDDDDDDDDDDSESEIFEPETSAKRGPNLQQELGTVGTSSSDEDEDDARRRDSWSSSGSEKVDWEGLQKKEDQECRTYGSDNVRARQLVVPWIASCVAFTAN